MAVWCLAYCRYDSRVDSGLVFWLAVGRIALWMAVLCFDLLSIRHFVLGLTVDRISVWMAVQ